jgi:hypothetical protein
MISSTLCCFIEQFPQKEQEPIVDPWISWPQAIKALNDAAYVRNGWFAQDTRNDPGAACAPAPSDSSRERIDDDEIRHEALTLQGSKRSRDRSDAEKIDWSPEILEFDGDTVNLGPGGFSPQQPKEAFGPNVEYLELACGKTAPGHSGRYCAGYADCDEALAVLGRSKKQRDPT